MTQQTKSTNDTTNDNAIEGEGSYSGTKQYNEATRKFIEQGKVEQAAKDAAPHDQKEAQQMREAEKLGKQHSKGEDPAPPSGETPESSAGS
ncbi:MAG TPA: hypothetical protein VFB54_10425 [Burkholderiales bacterium]|nr:hypothetical protein [Burkholderiales bacterium]